MKHDPLPTSAAPTPTGMGSRCARSRPIAEQSRRRRKIAFWILRGALVAAAALVLCACGGDEHLTFLNPQGPVAHEQRWHFYWVLAVMAVLVAAPIFLLLPFWAWRYRYGASKLRYTPNWTNSRILEAMSWGGPIVIVGILGFFVWKDSHQLDPYRPLASNQAPLRLQVIGYDWKWLIIYPDQGIATIGTMAIPVDRPVALQLTSATVMQSLFIPALGSQIYAMGGMVTQLHLQASKPGRYLGENTMYSGNGFHQQKFTAIGMSAADFKSWVQTVRTHGTVLDAKTLDTIALKSTRADMVKALPSTGAGAGSAYFSHASANIFPAVVRATMDGTQQLPDQAFKPGSAPTYKPKRPSATLMERFQ